MKLVLKIIGYTTGVLFALFALAVIALQLISEKQYRKWAEAAAESATGRQLEINGDFDVRIGTTLALLAGDIHLANADWGTRDTMVSVDRLFIELDLLPLFKGVLDFTIELGGPDILMETSDAGQGNWVFKEAAPALGPDQLKDPDNQAAKNTFALPVKPYIRNLQVTDLHFVYKDTSGDAALQAEVELLRLFVDGSNIPLELKGAYQGVPVSLNGSLGRIEDWHENRRTPVSLGGKLNESVLKISGTAGPVLPEPNARLDVSLAADSIATFGELAGMTLPDLQHGAMSLTFVAENGRLATENISVVLDDPRLSLDVTGEVTDLTRMDGIDLTVSAFTDDGSGLLDGLGRQLSFSLPPKLRINGQVKGSAQSLAIRDLELVVRDQGLEARLAATLSNVTATPDGAAELLVELDSTALLGTYLGMDLPQFGPFKGSARLSSMASALRLDVVDLELDDPAASVVISGSANRIGRNEENSVEIEGLYLDTTAKSEQLQIIFDRFGVTVPGTLPASFSVAATAKGSLEKLEIKALRAAVVDEGLDIRLTGSADNAIDGSGIVADLAAAVDDTVVLGKYAGIELPVLGPLKLDGQVVSSGDSYRLESLGVQLDGELAEARLAAQVEDLLALTTVATDPSGYGAAGINASITAATPSAAALARLAGVEMPDIGALQLEGNVGSSARSLQLDDLQATLRGDGFTAELTAEIVDLIALTGIRMAIDGDLTSLAALSELADTELPETDPWNIQVRADSDNLRSAPVNISADLSSTGISAAVDAVVEDIKTPDTFQAELAFKAETIATVGKLLGRDLPEGKPLTLTAHASGQPGGYRVDTFLIESGDSSMTANLEYLTPAAADVERNTLKGLVAIRGFDTTPWLIVPQEGKPAVEEAVPPPPVKAESQAQEATEKSTGKRIFSDEPFAFDLLREYDVDLKLETEDVMVPSGVDLDSEIGISLDHGLLEVSPFVIAESSGGSGYGYVTLDARSSEAKLDAEIDFDNFTSPRFGGYFNLNFDLEGAGKSPASLMGSLNGYLTTSIDDMELKKSFLTTFGAGLVSRLNPLGKDKTMLECAVVRFDIEDGVADFDKKLAAQTTEVTWIGGGKIDFKTEEIKGGISSKPRQVLSSLTNVVDVAGFVLVDGTLAEPTFGIDVANVVTDAAKKYAQYTAFFMTGGLSWLAEKAVETAQANVDQCERILADLEDL